jgi:hypothetical protein
MTSPRTAATAAVWTLVGRALAIVALGILIAATPSAIPGLTPPM